ncbi:MAG TPA: hypothetical protein PK796_11970, partial [Bacteroidales bacterium]|nr:hypothetical protein [Bacteroidales bacterium]
MKRIFFVLTILSTYHVLKGQNSFSELPAITQKLSIPSAEIGSFTEYGNMTAANSHGALNYSIPLY